MPDVYKACDRFEELGVPFIKTPTGGMYVGVPCICMYIIAPSLLEFFE